MNVQVVSGFNPVRRVSQIAHVLCLASLLAIGSMAFAAPAAARPVTVGTRDLDLSSVDDARILLRRLDRAADEVCEGAFVRQYHGSRRRYAACHESVMAQTVARLGAPVVHEQYALRLDASPLRRRSAGGDAASGQRISRQQGRVG